MRERAATADDHRLFVDFQKVLGIEQGALPADRWRENAMPATFFLETDGGEVMGYALCRPYGPRGDVRQIAVSPAHQRRGVGRELMRRVAAKLRAAGCVEWRLEVRADNAPALALYRAVGMQPLRRQTVFRSTAAELEAVLAGAVILDDELRTVGADDDELDVATRFDLPPGKLARMELLRPGGVVLAIERGDHVVALARFHPELAPGLGIMFPLRAGSAMDAQALLAACLRGAALPPEVELCVDDRPVRDWLIAAGLAPREELEIMGGALPP